MLKTIKGEKSAPTSNQKKTRLAGLLRKETSTELLMFQMKNRSQTQKKMKRLMKILSLMTKSAKT